MANNDFDNTVGNSMRDLGNKAGNLLTDGVNTAANAVVGAVDTMANSVSSSASPAMTTGVGTTPVRTQLYMTKNFVSASNWFMQLFQTFFCCPHRF